ncbi:hypothetical protein XELAEV_18046778mg [Xenopus laevis]|uniref:Uncharacterized protein n=1 Tax=Xenopus laevis TaxID=8355 RepID=A0A974BU92_XENLA|nr:hypothetical protein XELAEV_18046778mg [Xenopus laevis]
MLESRARSLSVGCGRTCIQILSSLEVQAEGFSVHSGEALTSAVPSSNVALGKYMICRSQHDHQSQGFVPNALLFVLYGEMHLQQEG